MMMIPIFYQTFLSLNMMVDVSHFDVVLMTTMMMTMTMMTMMM
jgi:hypothetical protein